MQEFVTINMKIVSAGIVSVNEHMIISNIAFSCNLNDNNMCTMSIKNIAKASFVSKSTVDRSIKNLIEKGFLKRLKSGLKVTPNWFKLQKINNHKFTHKDEIKEDVKMTSSENKENTKMTSSEHQNDVMHTIIRKSLERNPYIPNTNTSKVKLSLTRRTAEFRDKLLNLKYVGRLADVLVELKLEAVYLDEKGLIYSESKNQQQLVSSTINEIWEQLREINDLKNNNERG